MTVPNGRLSETRIESFGARDRIRFATKVGLTYDATRAQVQQVLDGMERVMREHPNVGAGSVVVRLAALGASSLEIEVECWFATTDYGRYRDWRQQVLLDFMRVVEEAGTSFAFPTSTVHVVSHEAAGAEGDGAPRR